MAKGKGAKPWDQQKARTWESEVARALSVQDSEGGHSIFPRAPWHWVGTERRLGMSRSVERGRGQACEVGEGENNPRTMVPKRSKGTTKVP